jgi:hypothetical protein
MYGLTFEFRDWDERNGRLHKPENHHGQELLRRDARAFRKFIRDRVIIRRPDGSDEDGDSVGRLEREDEKPDCRATAQCDGTLVDVDSVRTETDHCLGPNVSHVK